MCLNPVSIFNPSKYVSLRHGDQFSLTVPCGHCCECQESKHDEWYFRTHYQFLDTLKAGGFVLFDTLTYSDSYLPHVSDFYSDLDKRLDFPCFNRKNIRDFFVRLRRKLDYYGYDGIKYFLTSEYGTDPKFTHRPHYHILIFAHDIEPLTLAKFIFDCWKYGRTDVWSNCCDLGEGYLSERLFTDYSLHGMRLANYVSKYVMKDSEFQSVIDERLDLISDALSPIDYNDYSTELEHRSFRIKLSNIISQFHLQSNYYGYGYLTDNAFDMDNLFKTGMVSMLVPKISIYKHIPLPLYYFRHLFCKMVVIRGKRMWILNEDGKKYRRSSINRNIENYAKHFDSFRLNLARSNDYNKWSSVFDSVDSIDFANYVLTCRGRFEGNFQEYSSILDKLAQSGSPLNIEKVTKKGVIYYDISDEELNAFEFFHYSSNTDKLVFGKKFLSPSYLGSDIEGYDEMKYSYNRQSFSQRYCYFDDYFEPIYKAYIMLSSQLNQYKQNSFDYTQKLEKLYNQMFARV